MYTDIDSRVSQLGYMIKYLAKTCDIGDASRGTISSYAYIIMMIHFLQRCEPPVLPILQEMSDPENAKSRRYKKCAQWNTYFYDNLSQLRKTWSTKNQSLTGALWLEFLCYYTEKFNYEEHIVCIRKSEPLLRQDKGWFRRTIAIEDPFELSHNLAGGLNMKNWTMIRRVFINARKMFGIPPKDIKVSEIPLKQLEEILFDVHELCPENAPKRCPWCEGSFHIRKHCPKFATVVKDSNKEKHNDSRTQRTPTDNHESMKNNTFRSKVKRNPVPMFPQWGTDSQNQVWHSTNLNLPAYHYNMVYENSSMVTYTNLQHSTHHNRGNKNVCFKCNQAGHIRKNCPMNSTQNQHAKSKPT